MVAKQRLDNLLVERGLASSRTKAQALIMAGEVVVGGSNNIKPGALVALGVEITVKEPPPFVGRGGIKLDHALNEFQIDVSSKIAADIGASTGGFTDCLLKRGASQVYAVDVGYGQLSLNLRRDPRVVVMERVNARYPVQIDERIDLATVDLSFISVEKVLPAVADLVKEEGCIIVLLKPQFEAKRQEVGKRGIIRNPLLHARILGRFISWAAEHGFRLNGLVSSPILGASGNREFFILLRNSRKNAH